MIKIKLKNQFLYLLTILGVFILPSSFFILAVLLKYDSNDFISKLAILASSLGILIYILLVLSFLNYYFRLKNTVADYLIVNEDMIGVPNINLRYFWFLAFFQPTVYHFSKKEVSLEILNYSNNNFYILYFIDGARRVMIPSKNIDLDLTQIEKLFMDLKIQYVKKER